MPSRKTSSASKRSMSMSFMAQPIILMAVLIGMILTAGYLWIMNPQQMASIQLTQREILRPKPSLDIEATNVIQDVSRILVTNTGERPSVFNITDPEAFLKQWPLGGQVVKGDKVLVWSDKTVVYSPSKGKIVSMLSNPSDGTSAAKTMAMGPLEAGVTVEVRNGSGVAGAGARLREVLTAADLSVSRVGDAKTRPVGTQVIDLSGGTNPNALAKVAALAGGAVSELPAGEPASTASILVIIGR